MITQSHRGMPRKDAEVGSGMTATTGRIPNITAVVVPTAFA